MCGAMSAPHPVLTLSVITVPTTMPMCWTTVSREAGSIEQK
jgi:hypothetical protein